LFVLVSSFRIFVATCAKLITLSFWVDVKLFCRIISYYWGGHSS